MFCTKGQLDVTVANRNESKTRLMHFQLSRAKKKVAQRGKPSRNYFQICTVEKASKAMLTAMIGDSGCLKDPREKLRTS